MWGLMKEWLKVGSLPDDNVLTADLKAVDYGYDASVRMPYAAPRTGLQARLVAERRLAS
jgi:hypothetical protein